MPTLNHYLRLRFRAIKYRLRRGRQDLNLLLEVAQPGDTVIDIGAHKGAYTYWLAKRVGKSGRVFAFEPQPRLAKALQDVFASWKHVSVFGNAVSDRAGEAVLFQPGGEDTPAASLNGSVTDSGGRTGVPVPVQTIAIDNFLAAHGSPKVTVIKCDVEGHELAVFKGARTLLETQNPVLYFECEERLHSAASGGGGGVGGGGGGSSMSAVFDFLHSLGYHGQFFDAGRLHPLTDFDPTKHQTPGVEPYINNFFFEKKAPGKRH